MLSPKELADALGVSESSLKRWVDSGRIVAARTEGGHRRIALPEAVRYIRESGAPIVRPELLDMPEVAVAQQRASESASEALFRILAGGDAVAARGWVLARYLAGASIAELADGPVRDAMHRIGELWNHDDEGIFVEHRATDCCLQAIAHLRSMFEPPADAPVAVGGAPEDDPYLLPSLLAATTCAAAGLRAVNLGPDTPLEALSRAIERHSAWLVWLSFSSPVPAARARAIARWLAKLPPGITAVIGGRHVDRIAIRKRSVRRTETMAELAAIATELARIA